MDVTTVELATDRDDAAIKATAGLNRIDAVVNLEDDAASSTVEVATMGTLLGVLAEYRTAVLAACHQ